MQATDIQEVEIKISLNLPYVEGSTENYSVHSDLTKYDPLSTLKTLCINYFVNQKIEWLQKIKITFFMKLTLVTAMQSTSVNLNGL